MGEGGAVDAQLAGRCLAQQALERGLGLQRAVELTALGGRERIGTSDALAQAGEDLLAHDLVAAGALGVAADHEAVAVGALIDADLLDAQVACHGVVAALAGERGPSLLGAMTELFADDVVAAAALQVAAIALALKAAVEHPDHAREVPVAQVVSGLADDRLV